MAACFEHARRAVAAIPGAELRALCTTALDITTAQYRQHGGLPAADVVLDVLDGCGHAVPAAVAGAVAASCICVYSGADTMDNVADDELPHAWDGASRAAISTAGAALIASVAHIALCEAQLDEARQLHLHRRLARGTATMAAGQVQDLARQDEPGAVLRGVRDKSGAEVAMFAGMAAIAAGLAEPQVRHIERWGEAVGTAAQLSSDCHDLAHERPSRDLLAGAVTLPVAYALGQNDSRRRAGLAELLAAARRNSEIHDDVVREIAAAGGMACAAVVVAAEIRAGLLALDRAGLQADTAALRDRLERLALLSRQERRA